MNHLRTIDSIIFDLDGTLWDSATGVASAWNEALAAFPFVNKRLTAQDIYNVMGLTMDDIILRFFPEYDTATRETLLHACCAKEHEYLSVHGGILFPHLEETLAKLSKKYKLFIVSNCQKGYIECFLNAHQLSSYFTDIDCWGNTLLPKGDTIRILMQRNQIEQAIYVGDTQGDADASAHANIPFVYAQYGFGKVQKYDYKIQEISELLNLLT